MIFGFSWQGREGEGTGSGPASARRLRAWAAEDQLLMDVSCPPCARFWCKLYFQWSIPISVAISLPHYKNQQNYCRGIMYRLPRCLIQRLWSYQFFGHDSPTTSALPTLIVRILKKIAYIYSIKLWAVVRRLKGNNGSGKMISDVAWYDPTCGRCWLAPRVLQTVA